jgi:hypothetical protein
VALEGCSRPRRDASGGEDVNVRNNFFNSGFSASRQASILIRQLTHAYNDTDDYLLSHRREQPALERGHRNPDTAGPTAIQPDGLLPTLTESAQVGPQDVARSGAARVLAEHTAHAQGS